MEEPESYIDRIQRLANRNKELKSQLDDLVARFSAIETQNKSYQDALSKFSLDAEKKPKDARKHAKRLRMVSLIYVSVRGFHKLYKFDDPAPMIDLLDELYLALDEIAFLNNIVKIKSVGDVNIYAAGLQTENRTNPIDVVQVALEMQKAVKRLKKKNSLSIWRLRIGLHTGPLTAVPNGNKVSTYSFSGDSINIACRIGEAVSGSSIGATVMTYELIKEFYDTRLIGKIPVKYKGNLGVYQIRGIIPELESETEPGIPNEKFKLKYSTLQFMDVQEELLDYLEKKLPADLYYHNIKHTIDVVTEVELIGWAEGVSDEDVLLLKLAALFHDAGHTISYKDHEHYGTVMAREKLSSYDFSPQQIDTVCRLIMATKMPPAPSDILEKIICDSDLDYLGRTDFIPVSNTLYKELHEHDMIGSWSEWNKLQLKFIRKHQYFTKTARQLREVNKQQQIERLEQLIKESTLIE
ncbi:adenylate/guanylate cyclase domain-containing protein [Alkalitalea saponilacus]|nr:adenylate/guanylate cyclase domain-containing protein [Alkalitalea saponilacus]ASB51156.1 guanylate cyclase [Alkalitalea saponilacus]